MTEMFTRNFNLAPSTFNRQAGTVDAVLSTGAPVTRRVANSHYIERLSTDPASVTIMPHVPLLDGHNKGRISDVLGRVGDVRHEAGQLVATLRISNRDALDAVERGDINGVSIGYGVDRWEDSRDANSVLTRTATQWRLFEASLVPLPADHGATLRSHTMPDPAPVPAVIAPPAPAVIIPPAAPAHAQRNRSIRELATRSGLDAAWADEMIDSDADMAAVRNAALDAILARSAATGAIRTQTLVPGLQMDPASMEHRVTAILHRTNPTGFPITDQARPFMHYRMADHARDLLQARGISTSGMGPDQLITRAGEATTSDFPNLLQSVGNRSLIQPYQAAISPLRALFVDKQAVDFRLLHRLALSEMPQLKPITESGEVTSGGRAEVATTYGLSTYARKFGLSREALINDDLNAFSDSVGAFARAAAETENNLRIALLLQNSGAGPLMYDGNALFTTGHGNLTSSGTTLSVASLGVARQLMRNQKSLDGVTPINVVPSYLLVGPALETVAEQTIHEITATQVTNVNPFAGKITLMVEPRITSATNWYLFAAPAARPVFEQAHLASAPGPQIASRPGWDTLGIEFRCVLDFGCGAIDFRGAYRNVGA